MKKIAFIALGVMVGCTTTQKPTANAPAAPKVVANPVAYATTITEGELKEHLYTYASDEFEGRETGQPGQKKAIAYLKKHYVDLGIPAAQGGDDYFQNVPLEMSKLPSGDLTVNGKTVAIGDDVLTFSEATGTFSELVYVGYGIEEGSYNDYAGIDVTGKAILMKSGEPQNSNGSYVLSGTDEKSVWSNMSESIGKRTELAEAKGAVAVFYYDDANFDRYKRRFDYMKANDSGRMGIKTNEKSTFSSFFINKAMATTLMSAIDTDNTPKSLALALNLNIKSSNEPVVSENVVAVLKGSEKPDEYVVISSHLDHIGISKNGDINNGADDDGSGSVALLEIAEAFKKAADEGNGPKRSVVFLHVTGEEKGLLGSRYYTDFDPIFPLAQTVANLNIDMVGRIDPKREGDRNYIYLIGSDKLSTELHELSEEVNAKYTNIALDYTYNDENDPNRFYYRSDHYNFAKNNIPIIFYFNGTHADYHRESDSPEKINYDLLENRTRLVFHTAWEVANRANKLIVDKPTE